MGCASSGAAQRRDADGTSSPPTASDQKQDAIKLDGTDECQSSERPVRRGLTVMHMEGMEEVFDETVQLGDEEPATKVLPVLPRRRQPEDDGDLRMGKASSVSSKTDYDGKRRNSFVEKDTEQAGRNCGKIMDAMGYACRKGLKPDSPNQDSWFAFNAGRGVYLYGVLDGHGEKGHDISEFVKANLPPLIIKDRRLLCEESADRFAERGQMLQDHFATMTRMIETASSAGHIRADSAGTTLTVVIHDSIRQQLSVGHVGDSRACLGRISKETGEVTARAITVDHKPELPEERERILKAGGDVRFDGYNNHRVYVRRKGYPGLNMSRCFGDLFGANAAGLSSEPAVSHVKLSPEDEILLICSDGVWEFMGNQEAVEIVEKFVPQESMDAADALANSAWDLWVKHEGAMVDDITALVVRLQMSTASSLQEFEMINI